MRWRSRAPACSAARYRDDSGRDETRHLAYAEEIVTSGRTQAERLLELYHGRWNGSVMPAFKECVF